MIRIILSGCFGKMGHVIRDCVSSRNDCEIVAGVDIGDGKAEFPVFKSFDSTSGVDADVIIDFSHPSCFERYFWNMLLQKSALRL